MMSPGIIGSTFNTWVTSGHSQGMQNRHSFLLDAIYQAGDFQPDSRVLDVCCGEGWAVVKTAKIATQGIVVGIDISEAMISQAQKWKPLPQNSLFLHGDVTELPFGPEQFTHVYSIEAIYYIENVRKLFNKIYSSLMPGGRFLTAINYYADNPHTTKWSQEINIPLYNRSIEEYSELLREAGCTAITSVRVLDPTPLPQTYTGKWFKDTQELYAFHKEGALLLYGQKPLAKSCPRKTL